VTRLRLARGDDLELERRLGTSAYLDSETITPDDETIVIVDGDVTIGPTAFDRMVRTCSHEAIHAAVARREPDPVLAEGMHWTLDVLMSKHMGRGRPLSTDGISTWEGP
jgi:hypothetical protein